MYMCNEKKSVLKELLNQINPHRHKQTVPKLFQKWDILLFTCAQNTYITTLLSDDNNNNNNNNKRFLSLFIERNNTNKNAEGKVFRIYARLNVQRKREREKI